jgi:hypothetical protein
LITETKKSSGRSSPLLDGSLDEHVEELHDLHGVLERGEWIQRLRHVWREDHGDVARAHLVGLLLLGDVGHEVDGPVEEGRLGRRQPGAEAGAVVLRLAPRHLVGRQRTAGELTEPDLFLFASTIEFVLRQFS